MMRAGALSPDKQISQVQRCRLAVERLAKDAYDTEALGMLSKAMGEAQNAPPHGQRDASWGDDLDRLWKLFDVVSDRCAQIHFVRHVAEQLDQRDETRALQRKPG